MEGNVKVKSESMRGIRESLFFGTAGNAGMGVLLLGTMGAGHKKAKGKARNKSPASQGS